MTSPQESTPSAAASSSKPSASTSSPHALAPQVSTTSASSAQAGTGSSGPNLDPSGPNPAAGGHAHAAATEERGELGANLKSWWKSFRERDTKGKAKESAPSSVFAVPLQTSLSFASVQISTAGPDGSLYVWGYIPVVVAKCGLHLKETATEVRGTFRVSGSSKRMKELQTIFETPPKYGKNLDWKKVSFTTHDVATILRRYLTSMPEPIIPLELYHDFRDVLSQHLPLAETIAAYKQLISKMPKPNQYLLLYVLDLLSVFAKKSDKNLMTASNLSMIFQPGILAHPMHQMTPHEHALSQRVLEFLIEHQDHFLMEMQKQPTSPDPPPALARAQSPAQGQSLAPPPVSSSIHTSSHRRPSNASTTASRRAAGSPLAPPPPVRADADLMVPSDSDDEPPEGGYYVHQGDPVSVVRSKTLGASRSERRDPGSLPSTGLGIAMATRQKPRTGSENAMSGFVVVDNPPLHGGGGSFLTRRRTAPTRRTRHDDDGFFGRRKTKKRAPAAEAPS